MKHCVGWNCLTTAQIFGIVFSVVVIAVVLLIAWMYFLGRVARSRLSRNFRTLPGGRRARKNPNLPPTISLGELPIAQRWPGQPPQIFYQPVIYSIDTQHAARAQPYLIVGPCQPVRPQPVAYMPAQPQASVPHHAHPEIWSSQLPAPSQQLPQSQRRYCPPSQSGSLPSDDEEPRGSSWSQRLNRAFGLPLGRASTIASSTSKDPDIRSLADSTRQASPVREANDPGCSKPVAEEQQAKRSGQPSEVAQEQGDAQSICTQSSNIATVHSDDYDMVRPLSNHGNSINGLNIDVSNRACKLDVDFYRSLSTPVGNHTRPVRTPSPPPPAVVDLSSASDSISDTSNFSPSPVSGIDLPWNQSTELPKHR